MRIALNEGSPCPHVLERVPVAICAVSERGRVPSNGVTIERGRSTSRLDQVSAEDVEGEVQ